MAEGAWPAGADLELELTEGSPSATELARAEAAALRLVAPGSAPADGTVCVVDVPDPTSVASPCDPARLVVFDDSERFDGRAAAVVQPSLPAWHGRARTDRVLAGYVWAPIGASWRSEIGRVSETGRDRPRVLVCFGGSDPHGVTARLAPAIAAGRDWTTTVVVGHGYGGPRPPGVDILRDPVDLPARTADADVVVLGAGTMKFEVAALGRPALLVAVADDQLSVGPAFAASGAASWLGDGRSIDPECVHAAVRGLLVDAPARSAMSAVARRVIDGAGADRLAAEIAALA
jgi:hypothetical protein